MPNNPEPDQSTPQAASRWTLLTSRVARRIFLLFIVCALVPITVLAVYSFSRVSSQLYEHGEERLHDAVRATGQGIAERLLLLEAELRFLPGLPPVEPETEVVAGSEEFNWVTGARFLSVAAVDGDEATLLRGSAAAPVPELGPAERAHLAGGGTVLWTQILPGAPPLIVLVQQPDHDAPGRLLVGWVDPRFVWAGGAGSLPRNTELCVFDHTHAALFCTRPTDGVVPPDVHAEIEAGNSDNFEWEIDGDEYIASRWAMPLASQFVVPQWTMMLSEAKADLLKPMDAFRRAFPMVILLSLWLVALLSVQQIRRSLVPLERLHEGTRRIAKREFDVSVEIDSGDEFEELADSFNRMAGRLDKQFTALAAIADIDRTILSSLNIEEIVETVLFRMSDLVACDSVSVTLMSPDQQKVPRTYTLPPGAKFRPSVETTFFTQADFRRFSRSPVHSKIEPGTPIPSFVAPMARAGCKRFVVLPMFIREEASGAIALGFIEAPTYHDDDLEQVRQLTDQVAVALANTHLVEDLDALNWGALTALARAVDAKSPWTAGHSERVTSMGIRLGDKLKLTADEIDILHRGGLLHDVGKIGVPAAILDKPGKLTDEEFDIMKQHPAIGANILQPIAAYADVLPIVRHHHERWDGAGYPDGLAHKKIHFFARIYAVADVYDALVSDRPYRDGFSLEKIIAMIVEGRGSHFDPEVVDAFLRVMEDEAEQAEQAEQVSEAVESP